jgi:hypothetical protein
MGLAPTVTFSIVEEASSIQTKDVSNSPSVRIAEFLSMPGLGMRDRVWSARAAFQLSSVVEIQLYNIIDYSKSNAIRRW